MIDSPQDDSWLQERLRQAPWRTQAQGTSLVLAAVMIVAVIGALYLAQASRTAAAGRRLQQLEAQRQQLEQQNAQLRAEIAALRSVPRLTRDAQALGYHAASAGEVEYLPVRGVEPPPPQDVVAQRAGASPEAGQPVPEYDETLEGWLSEQLGAFRAQLADFLSSTFGPEATSPEEAP